MTERYDVTFKVSITDVEDVKEAIECAEESWNPPDWVTCAYPSFEKVEKYD